MNLPAAFIRPALLLLTVLALAKPLHAAPLTWFPGPSLDTPLSRAAAVVANNNNVVAGGVSDITPDGEGYLLSLAATNSYWSFLGYLSSVNIAPGAAYTGGNILIYGGSDGTNA